MRISRLTDQNRDEIKIPNPCASRSRQRHRRVRRYARRECTIASLKECAAEERECRLCPPLPPEGLAPWLHRIGFFKRRTRTKQHLVDGDKRFLRSVKKLPNGCWLWIGTTDTRGRPRFFFDHRRFIAYRWAYIRWRGDLAASDSTIRSCGDQLCVNPKHITVARRT